MARPAYSYRGARKKEVKRRKLVWRFLERTKIGDGSIYVPPVGEEVKP